MHKGQELSDYLTDILTATADALAFTSGMDYEAFEQDRKTVNAVIRSLEVIGEATKRIPGSFRQKHPISPAAKWPECETSSFTTTWELI